MFSPRNLVAGLLCLASVFHVSAWSQSWPSRPVQLVVPFSAGGTTDLLGRALAERLTKALDKPVVVENRAGAGSMIGTAHVAQAEPDGHTILLATASSMVVAPVFMKTPYDPVKDFAPVTIVASSPFVLSVHPSLPVTSTAELIEFAKANPGKLNMASFGNGSSSHLAGELFKAMAGVDMTHVPYKGSAPALTDLMGNQVQVMFDMVSASLPHHRAGKIRVLAVTGTQRSSAMPEIPIAADAVPGYEATAWFSIVAPAGTPEPILHRLRTEIVAALADPAMQKLLAEQSLEPVGNTPEEFAQVIHDDLVKWAKVVKDSGARP